MKRGTEVGSWPEADVANYTLGTESRPKAAVPIADPPRRGGDLLKPRIELNSFGYCCQKALSLNGRIATPRIGDAHVFVLQGQRTLLPDSCLARQSDDIPH